MQQLIPIPNARVDLYLVMFALYIDNRSSSPSQSSSSSSSPRSGWFAAVAGFIRAAHLVHPRPAVVFIATKDKAGVPVHSDVIVETCTTPSAFSNSRVQSYQDQ